MSDAAKQRAAREIAAGTRHPALGMKHTEEFKQMVSLMFRGAKLSAEHRRKIGEASRRNNTARFLHKLTQGQFPEWTRGKQTGPKHYRWPEERRLALAERQRGEKSHLWRGGETPESVLARLSVEYQIWRKAVLARDKETCQDCGHVSRRNHAHHLKALRVYAEMRYDVENGVTLCGRCHRIRENQVSTARKRGEFGGPLSETIPSQAQAVTLETV